jgi:hypothetical protein
MARARIPEFESCVASQLVRSLPLFAGGAPKSAQIGPIRRIGRSLRVPDWAPIAAFRLSASEGQFRCLVFQDACTVERTMETRHMWIRSVGCSNHFACPRRLAGVECRLFPERESHSYLLDLG